MKKINFIKFKMADLRPLPIDKFSRERDSINIFLCIAPKCIPYIHSTNSLDEFKIVQDSDRNKVMAAKIAYYQSLSF